MIEPNDYFVSFVIGNEINVNANRIELNGAISSAPGYKVNLNFRDEIVYGGNVKIEPNIEIQQKIDFFGSGFTKEASEEELKNYCSGPNKMYKADKYEKPNIQKNNKDTFQEINGISITIAPNPSDIVADIQIVAGEIGTTICQLFDITGKIIYQETLELKNHESKTSISTVDFSDG